MTIMTQPDFTLTRPNAQAGNATDAMWWLMLQLTALEPTTQNGGIYANKPGFHNKGKQVKDVGLYKSGTDYSIRQSINRQGPWWRDYASAFDWTFKTAQSGDFGLIALYSKRLMDAMLNPADTRVDTLYEFYGNTDHDRTVEGYNEWEERNVSSDSSHLWHIHGSFLRKHCGDFWAMWAVYTVFSGQTYAHWLSTLPGGSQQPSPPSVPPSIPAGLPSFALGSRTLRRTSPNMRGTDVLYVQKFAGGPAHFGPLDGVAGAKFEAGVKRYQRIRGITADGVVGPQTWRSMGVK